MKSLFSLFLFLALACTPKSSGNTGMSANDSNLQNQKGQIKMFLCSRGCYQYVIETQLNGKTVRLSPVTLDDAFKTPDRAVLFDGQLLSEYADINKPGPDDRPVLDFKAQKVKIGKIQ